MADPNDSGGRRYVVIAVVIMLLAALPFSPFVSFKSSQHIDTESATSDSNLPTQDSDNDGMPDWWEIDFNLDPFDASDASVDSDMDGHDKNRNGLIEEEEYFTNLMEFEMEAVLGNSTNPRDPDTDKDGMPDGWENYYNLNPISDLDASEDNDRDGYDYDMDGILSPEENFTNLEEYLAMTSPWSNDTDGDWMTDGWEVYWAQWLIDCLKVNSCTSKYNISDIDSTLSPIDSSDAWLDPDVDGWDSNYDNELSFEERYLNYMEFYNLTNPFAWDTEDDEMSDGWEVFFGLNPLEGDNGADMDGDELLNGEEYDNRLVLTDWLDTDGIFTTRPDFGDTDGDGLSDNDELYEFYTDPTNNDTDGDGMPDGWETNYSLNPKDPSDASEDLDNDGWDFNRDLALTSDEWFTNLQEYLNGTDPTNNDTDEDMMFDGWEAYYGLNPTDLSDAGLDSDNDGYDANRDGFVLLSEPYTNIEEFLNNTSPNDNDTDDDGISDGWEIYYGFSPLYDFDATIDYDIDGFDSNYNGTIEKVEEHVNLLEFQADTDPRDVDTDGDGMWDGWEWRYGLNPLNPLDADADSDSDGVINRYEYNNTAASGSYIEVDNITSTLPGDNDTDDDGLLDGWELFNYLTDPTSNDTDGDGMPDGWEIKYGLDPLFAGDAFEDLDDDGFDADWNDNLTEFEMFFNLYEYLNGTDPTNGDTDGDGMPDGWEVYWGFQPLNSSDSTDDPDNDSLINLYEYDNSLVEDFDDNVYSTDNITGSDPLLKDTDADLIMDGEECIPGSDGYVTDPSNPDSDGDGMSDGWELLFELNPFDADDGEQDLDNDGWDFNRNGTIEPWEKFTNYEEFLNGTDPRNNDTDGDGMPDGWEGYYGLDAKSPLDAVLDNDLDGYDSDGDGELSPDEKFTNYEEFLRDTNPVKSDTDSDNCTDGWEIYWNEHKPDNETRGLDPLNGTDGFLDYDDDGWEDWEGNKYTFPNWREEEAKTNPWDEDSDDDGMTDGFEADN